MDGRGTRTNRSGQRAIPAVPPSAHPGGAATAGCVSVGLGDLRASKRARTDRALRTAGSAVEASSLRGLAEKSDVGMRLDQAAGGRTAMVLIDGDRFLFALDRSLGCGADGQCGKCQSDLPGGA